MSDLAWLAAFGSDLNSASQSVTSTVGNGVGNTIGGNVITEGDQRVGDHGFSSFGPGGDNSAHQDVSATVANGAFNTVGGNVITEGHQSVGDHGFELVQPRRRQHGQPGRQRDRGQWPGQLHRRRRHYRRQPERRQPRVRLVRARRRQHGEPARQRDRGQRRLQRRTGGVITEGHQSVGDHGMAMHSFH